ncbi:MAG: hypothetical protein IJS94_03470, partial [Clostridia bacterium]|nr:hypothetical protein [Clostridia bacterium]
KTLEISPFIALTGIILSLILAFPLTLIGFSGKEPNGTAVALLSIGEAAAYLIIIAQLNKKIVYDEEGFTRTTLFGRKKRYLYNDITGIDEDGLKLWFGSERVNVGIDYEGRSEFKKYLKKRWRTEHNGAAIPKVKKADFFRGNLKNPGKMTARYVALLIFAVTVIPLCYTISRNDFTPEDLEYKDIRVVSYTEKDGDLILTGENGKTYSIEEYRTYTYNTDAMLITLSHKPTVRAGIYTYANDGDPIRVIVELSTRDGSVYADIDISNKRETDDGRSAMIFSYLAAALSAAYVICSVTVARGMDRLHPELVRIFFREWELNKK